MVQNSVTSEVKLNRYGVKYILREFIGTLVFLAILLISAGKFDWIHAWACTGLILSYQIINITVLFKINPQLLNKRGKIVQETTKWFDKIFVIIYLPLAFTIPFIAGFDAVRYQWSTMSFGLNILGGVIFVLSCIFGAWAMAVNAHFETTVLVQEKEQQVCTTGPYKIIRHPGYAAKILALISSSFLLDSWFALIPAGAVALLFVIRTALEDRTLQQELPGYKEYAKVTRYRLVPYIW